MSFQLHRRAGDCPLGGVFFRCSAEMGGFSGCCLEDPCRPGGFCPNEKDRTPGRVNATITSSTATPTMTSQASDVSFTKIPIPTASFETLTSSAAPTSRGDGSVQPTAYVTVSHQPSATSLSRSDSTSSRSLPLATIAGAAVGGSVLVALIIVILICLRRRRKQKSIYQAPIYISPYNSSRSFMPQKSPVYKAELRRSCGEIQQLDSRSIGVPRNLGNDSSRRFAELAVEPLTRRGV